MKMPSQVNKKHLLGQNFLAQPHSASVGKSLEIKSHYAPAIIGKNL
jgi:hypothetical protein